MNNQEKPAREWAINFSEDTTSTTYEQIQAAIEYTLENTSSETMADVAWDSDKHFLAGAVDPDGDEVVMAGFIGSEFIDAVLLDKNFRYEAYRENLTPNGKRYNLVEITERKKPFHPTFLETETDYENAPDGTIIAAPDHYPWIKDTSTWRSLLGWESSNQLVLVQGSKRTVLRWGWGDEE